jgi:uncharacterized membrane protein
MLTDAPATRPSPYSPSTQLVLPGIIDSAQQVHWQGPYPPPEAVERYEQILPGAFNRMISMAEQLQNAQIEQAGRALSFTQLDTKRGHWLEFFLSILAMGGAIGCLALEYPWVAVAFLSLPVMAVARALVESAKSQSATELDLVKASTETLAAEVSPCAPQEQPPLSATG